LRKRGGGNSGTDVSLDFFEKGSLPIFEQIVEASQSKPGGKEDFDLVKKEVIILSSNQDSDFPGGWLGKVRLWIDKKEKRILRLTAILRPKKSDKIREVLKFSQFFHEIRFDLEIPEEIFSFSIPEDFELIDVTEKYLVSKAH